MPVHYRASLLRRYDTSMSSMCIQNLADLPNSMKSTCRGRSLIERNIKLQTVDDGRKVGNSGKNTHGNRISTTL